MRFGECLLEGIRQRVEESEYASLLNIVSSVFICWPPHYVDLQILLFGRFLGLGSFCPSSLCSLSSW